MIKINIKGIKIFRSNIYKDQRGSFKETYKKKISSKLLIGSIFSSGDMIVPKIRLKLSNFGKFS
jgi:dTDP-4-dehydrorhamnose 3,5-epimerase-like enzyme